jgi:hypothetical protein
MLRDGAGDSLLSARTSGARRSMCGRDKGAFFGKADVNGFKIATRTRLFALRPRTILTLLRAPKVAA